VNSFQIRHVEMIWINDDKVAESGTSKHLDCSRAGSPGSDYRDCRPAKTRVRLFSESS
jgi:hypothetical protein